MLRCLINAVAVSSLSLYASSALSQPIPAAPQQPPMTLLKLDRDYRLNADGSYVLTETAVRRHNSEQSAQRSGQTRISYSPERESVEVLEAYTLTADGHRIEVSRQHEQQAPASATAPLYGDQRVVSLVFPALGPGAEMHQVVRRTVHRPVLPGGFSVITDYPRLIDVGSSSISLSAPIDMDISAQASDMEGGEVTASDGRRHWRWSVADIPPLEFEPGAVNPKDLGYRLSLSSFDDYSSLGAAYAERLLPAAEPTPRVLELSARIVGEATTQEAKTRALHAWTVRQLRGVPLDLEESVATPRPVDEVLEAGYADSLHLALTLKALLAAQGIDARLALSNGSNSHWRHTVAVRQQFDQALLWLPELERYVTPSYEILPFDTLPANLAGKPVLVLGEQGEATRLETLPLTSAQHERQFAMTRMTLDAEGRLEGETELSGSGLGEFFDRYLFTTIQPGTEAQVAAAALAEHGHHGSGTLEAQGDPRDLNQPFSWRSRFEIPEYTRVEAGESFALPAGIPRLGALVMVPRDFSIPERHQPYACSAIDKHEITELRLPQGVNPTTLPRDVEERNAAGAYTAHYRLDDRLLRAERRLVLTPGGEAGRAVCDGEDYQQQRALVRALARDLRGRIQL
ncbi:DUF3857 domain-containing protein [Halotalea alkalilenta]|uniref:DUF3857 domain-containing protein n=1 Tax=Halotalea alkalilenta TaxID=376489 RepID=UPI00047FE5FC|nr:DUF3857 domain-containing protein [Halotalea alkalilenta]